MVGMSVGSLMSLVVRLVVAGSVVSATATPAVAGSPVVDTVGAWLAWVWTLVGVRFIVGHVLVNLVVAIAAGMYTGEFQLKRVGEFLYRKLAPYVLVYAAVKAIGIDAGLEELAGAVWVIIEVTLAGDLAENLKVLGVPVPEWLLGGGSPSA